ncbi:hypothetical protein ACFL08_05630 [Patescibacteria group bacterium]
MSDDKTKKAVATTNGTTDTDVDVVEIEIDDVMLTVIDPAIEKMIANPMPTQTTMVAMFLSRCIIPVSKGVFTIPEKLLTEIVEKSKDAEKMSPIQSMQIKKKLKAYRDAVTGSGALDGEDIYDMVLSEAISDSPRLCRDFMKSVKGFCDAMKEVDEKHGSERASFRQELYSTGGRKAKTKKISDAAVTTPMKKLIIELNKLAAGEGGYRILSLIKNISVIGDFLSDETIINLFGVQDRTSMLNALDYRLDPDQVTLHENLISLMSMIESVMVNKKKVTNEVVGEIVELCIDIDVQI